ncbi:MAG: TonB family protein [Burkholderiales bacterium]
MNKTWVIRLAAAFVLYALCIVPAVSADELSQELTKTYRAYVNAFAQGNFPRAAELAADALELANQELGAEHAKTAIMGINLGHVLLLVGKVDEAEMHLQAAKSLIEKLRGVDDPDLATVHEDLAKIHASRNDLVKARAEIERATAITVKAHGEDDPQVAKLAVDEAALDIAAKNLDRASAGYQRALRIQEQSFGRESAQAAAILVMMGDLEQMSSRAAQAEQYYTAAVGIFEKILVEDDVRIIGTHAKLADLYLPMDDDRFGAHADRVIALSDDVEGAARPLFVAKPEFPAQQSVAMPQGWVLLEFAVTEAGHVTDPKVIESQPARIFDEPALGAARKWRFMPKVSGGARQKQPGTRARIVFKQEGIDVHVGEINR